MRLLKSSVMVAALFGLVCVGCKSAEQTAAEKKAMDEELAKLDGKWKFVSREGSASDPDAEGEGAKSKDDDKGLVYTIDKEKGIMSQAYNGQVDERLKLTLYPGKDPKQIDLLPVDEKGTAITYTSKTPANKKKKAKEKKQDLKRVGVYKVEGDKLTICFSWNSKDRPTDFTNPSGANRSVLVLQKVKSGTEGKKPEGEKKPDGDKKPDSETLKKNPRNDPEEDKDDEKKPKGKPND